MANNVKNRITLIGESKSVKKMIETFSTFFTKEKSKSFDGSLIFVNKNTNEFAWLNADNIFRRRGFDDVLGVQEGFEQKFDEEWTRFPDFDKIIKMPSELRIESDSWLMPLDNQFEALTPLKSHLDSLINYIDKNPGSKHSTVDNFIQGVRNYIDHGHSSWYTWSVQNWGTKWNSYGCSKISDNIFEFDTAWSGVPALIMKMSAKFPSVKIDYEYSCEDTGNNCGYASFKNGVGDVVELKNESKEAFDLAFKLRPEYQEYYVLIDGKYLNKEEEY